MEAGYDVIRVYYKAYTPIVWVASTCRNELSSSPAAMLCVHVVPT